MTYYDSSDMADGGLLLIYRGMTTERLLELQEEFTEQWIALAPYSSQAVGDKNYTKDPRGGLQNQLEHIQFVLNERGAGGTPGYVRRFVYDFSLGTANAQPAGTNDQLSY